MTEQNNQQFPNENDTATLNQMAADIRTLQSDMNFVKAELAKRTNPEFLSAFSQILKNVITDLKSEIKADLDSALAQQKTEIKADLELALAQQKTEFDQALAKQKVDFEQALAKQDAKFEQALNNLRDEIAKEFKLVRNEIKSVGRNLHPIMKELCDQAMRLDMLEDKVEKVETKLAS
jgi:gas vesicle protein